MGQAESVLIRRVYIWKFSMNQVIMVHIRHQGVVSREPASAIMVHVRYKMW